MTRLSAHLVFLLGLPLALFFGWHMRVDMHPPSGQIMTLRNVYVVQTLTPYRYRLRSELGHDFVAEFCEDYEPQFDTAETLDVLTVEDYGKCWSVANTHPAYLIRRNAKGEVLREAK